MKKTVLSTAILMALGTTAANAQVYDFAGTFTFIDALGVADPPDTNVTGIFDLGTASGNFSSSQPFNGYIWNADVDTMFQYDTNGAATQTFQYEWENRRYTTYDSSASTTLSQECRVGVTINGCQPLIDDGWNKKGAQTKLVGYDFDLTNPGQFAAGVFFDWSVNLDIPVLATLQITNDPMTSGGVLQVASFDGRVAAYQSGGAENPLVTNYIASPDGYAGNRMIVGPFPNQTPAFGGTMTPVPVPAAVWLFGSGLLGLVGVARRRKV